MDSGNNSSSSSRGIRAEGPGQMVSIRHSVTRALAEAPPLLQVDMECRVMGRRHLRALLILHINKTAADTIILIPVTGHLPATFNRVSPLIVIELFSQLLLLMLNAFITTMRIVAGSMTAPAGQWGSPQTNPSDQQQYSQQLVPPRGY